MRLRDGPAKLKMKSDEFDAVIIVDSHDSAFHPLTDKAPLVRLAAVAAEMQL